MAISILVFSSPFCQNLIEKNVNDSVLSRYNLKQIAVFKYIKFLHIWFQGGNFDISFFIAFLSEPYRKKNVNDSVLSRYNLKQTAVFKYIKFLHIWFQDGNFDISFFIAFLSEPYRKKTSMIRYYQGTI